MRAAGVRTHLTVHWTIIGSSFKLPPQPSQTPSSKSHRHESYIYRYYWVDSLQMKYIASFTSNRQFWSEYKNAVLFTCEVWVWDISGRKYSDISI